VFLVGAVALGGCCISGNGCYAPVVGAPTAPIAWDGLGSPPTETADVPESRPKKTTRPKKEIIVGPIGDVAAGGNRKSQADEAWAEQEAADQADETKLKRQLKQLLAGAGPRGCDRRCDARNGALSRAAGLESQKRQPDPAECENGYA